jgi:hypothetical protein
MWLGTLRCATHDNGDEPPRKRPFFLAKNLHDLDAATAALEIAQLQR